MKTINKSILILALSLSFIGCQNDNSQKIDINDKSFQNKNRSINEYSVPLNSSTMEIFLDIESYSINEIWPEYEKFKKFETDELYYTNGLQFWMKIFNQCKLSELSDNQINILISDNENLENNIPCTEFYFKLLSLQTKTLDVDTLLAKADSFKNKNLNKIEEIDWQNAELKKTKKQELTQSYYKFIKRLTW